MKKREKLFELPPRRERRVNGITISYLERGRGEPFVMMHGMMSNAVDFLFQFREFGGEFRCLAPDLRGHGMSRTGDPADAGIGRAVEDMEAFIGGVAPEGGVTLLGHSFGGMVARELLARMPERLRRVVLVAAPTGVAGRPVFRIGIDLFNLAVPFVKPLMSGRVIDFYSKWINMPPWSLNDDLRALLKERNSLINGDDLVTMGACFSSLKEWRAPALSGEAARVPVLAVYGRNDRLVKKKNINELAREIPNCRRHAVKGAMHSPMNEKAEVFNALLREFFKET